MKKLLEYIYFETVKEKKFMSIVSQLKNQYPPRRLIDSTWLTILGVTDEIDSFLDRLYDLTAKEIESLKLLMKEHESMAKGISHPIPLNMGLIPEAPRW